MPIVTGFKWDYSGQHGFMAFLTLMSDVPICQ